MKKGSMKNSLKSKQGKMYDRDDYMDVIKDEKHKKRDKRK